MWKSDQVRQKPTLSFDEAKLKGASYCAYQERCQQEVRDKLYSLGLHQEDVELLIAWLITENFLNEERFAKSYAGGKFRIKKWGKIKIKLELEKRKLSRYCVNKGLEEIDIKDYLDTLTSLITQKKTSLTGKPPVVKNKLARYAIGKGFEPNLVWSIINSL